MVQLVLFVCFIFYLYGSLCCCVYGSCCLIQNKRNGMLGYEMFVDTKRDLIVDKIRTTFTNKTNNECNKASRFIQTSRLKSGRNESFRSVQYSLIPMSHPPKSRNRRHKATLFFSGDGFLVCVSFKAGTGFVWYRIQGVD